MPEITVADELYARWQLAREANVEPKGPRRLSDRWRGEAVEVIHHIQQADVLSVGPTAGVLEQSDDTGILLSISDPQRGSVEHRFFPWSSVIQIIAPLG
jgi:hypothetical protein